MFAKFINNKAFFGLPGNPISSAACFRFFVLPYLFFSTEVNENKPINTRLKTQFKKKKNFTRFIKGQISFSKKGIAEFKVQKGQESFRIKPFTYSNAWGLFPNGKDKFKKGDFIYDGGPTVITAPYLFEELFNLFNKKISDYVEIVPLDLWYRFVFSDGQTFDYSGDEKSMEKVMP